MERLQPPKDLFDLWYPSHGIAKELVVRHYDSTWYLDNPLHLVDLSLNEDIRTKGTFGKIFFDFETLSNIRMRFVW